VSVTGEFINKFAALPKFIGPLNVDVLAYTGLLKYTVLFIFS
jgi:hypothetical protein